MGEGDPRKQGVGGQGKAEGKASRVHFMELVPL